MAKIYQNKMKFTINFQNFLTPFFQKYTATLKNLSQSPGQQLPPKAPNDFVGSTPQREPEQAPADNFVDFFNQTGQGGSTRSSPFDAGEEAKMSEVRKAPQSKAQGVQNFDFSDLGNPDSKFSKQSDFRFEKKEMGTANADEGKLGRAD